MVKWSRYRPGVVPRVGRGIALLFHDRGTRRGEWSATRPGRTLPPGKSRYPIYRRLGGPQGRSGRAENLDPTEIRSRTVQPVFSRYTDWATRPLVDRVLSRKVSVEWVIIVCILVVQASNHGPKTGCSDWIFESSISQKKNSEMVF